MCTIYKGRLREQGHHPDQGRIRQFKKEGHPIIGCREKERGLYVDNAISTQRYCATMNK